MNENIKEWIKYIIVIFLAYWIIGIVRQVLPPRGIIGVTIAKDDKIACNSKIINFDNGLPASESGLLVNDCIVSVNGEDIRNKDYNYAVSKIKGKPGTDVKININRNAEEFEYTVSRVKNKIDWFFIFK